MYPPFGISINLAFPSQIGYETLNVCDKQPRLSGNEYRSRTRLLLRTDGWPLKTTSNLHDGLVQGVIENDTSGCG